MWLLSSQKIPSSGHRTFYPDLPPTRPFPLRSCSSFFHGNCDSRTVTKPIPGSVEAQGMYISRYWLLRQRGENLLVPSEIAHLGCGIHMPISWKRGSVQGAEKERCQGNSRRVQRTRIKFMDTESTWASRGTGIVQPTVPAGTVLSCWTQTVWFLIRQKQNTIEFWPKAQALSPSPTDWVITWDELVPLQGMTIFNLLHLSIIPGWRERSKVKRMYWSCKGPKFKSWPRIRQLTTMCNSSSKESDASGLTYAYPHRNTHIYTEFKIK